MESIFPGMTAAELLETAIVNERATAEFYGRLALDAAAAGRSEAAAFFRDQTTREWVHYHHLVRYRDRKGLRGRARNDDEGLAWLTPEVDRSGADGKSAVGLDDAIRATELAEERAERFYRNAAREIEERELADLFSRLAEEEGRHRIEVAAQRTRRERIGEATLSAS